MPFTRERALTAAVVLAACLPYLSVIPDYFVQDDFGTVYILTARPWTMFPRWFTMPWMEFIWGYTPDEIRPFVAFTYQLTGKFAPSRPEWHHVFNIAMHAGNAVLVMAIARAALTLSPVGAAFAGIVFAVLPAQAESAAWITGRVDSMPAFFYLATFLAYVRWRLHERRSAYAWSLVLFFITLFSKQNAITMTATLAAYDLVVLDKERRGTVASTVAAWTPFVVMTASYLLLRRLLLGHTVRGGIEAWHQVETFLGIVERHLYRVTLGHLPPFSGWEIAAAALIAGLTALTIVTMRARGVRLILCFVIAWWWIGSAPVLVAGYESPRHVYLASAAWAFLLGIIVDGVRPLVRGRALRLAAAAAAILLVGAYLVRLEQALETWHRLARISKSAVERIHDEVVAAPQGTLFLVSLPKKSWEWGVPFVLRPPYQPEDLTARAHLVTPWALYCCGAQQWGDYARRHLQGWLNSPRRAPLVALYFDPATGEVSRSTDAENPMLAELVPVLLQTDTPEALDLALVQMLERFVKKR